MEQELLSEFKQDAMPLLRGIDSHSGIANFEWDWMFLMQHYRVPTRLMDWTVQPLVAMFFALDESEVTAPDGAAALWALKPVELNKAGKVITSPDWAIPLCGDHAETMPYLTSALSTGIASRELPPLAVTAARRFDRIRAQGGVFTVVHKITEPLEVLNANTLVKYEIPHDAKSSIREELEVLGINEFSIYPDLDHLGRRVARRLP